MYRSDYDDDYNRFDAFKLDNQNFMDVRNTITMAQKNRNLETTLEKFGKKRDIDLNQKFKPDNTFQYTDIGDHDNTEVVEQLMNGGNKKNPIKQWVAPFLPKGKSEKLSILPNFGVHQDVVFILILILILVVVQLVLHRKQQVVILSTVKEPIAPAPAPAAPVVVPGTTG